ncbi:hypothetical protein SAMN05216241_101128 [Limimonas halophila]|uniref:Phytase-like domain-containing protein n=1 Tax=Limimonas halophila TaxID=1082479 RepID=A0A1G7L5V3_9PROT|nr:esterase-like activity of phytase family protein [Limimonas halophila]SDF44795.1 hypothetical protein SAMN05216241_101128 [Limimonas halophila]
MLVPHIRLLAVLALAALIAVGGPAAARPLTLTATPLAPVDGAAPGTRVGPLTYLGGVVLDAPEPNFGGLSGLLLRDGGRRLTAVSDAGAWLRAAVDLDARGAPQGVSAARMGRLRDSRSNAILNKTDGDAESLARAAGGGLLVAFEGRHRIRSYGGPDAAARPVPIPDAVADAAPNKGLEAVTKLSDGRLLLIAEGGRTESGLPAWVRAPDGGWRALTYRTRDGFSPTGATGLPGGDALVLERKVKGLLGFRARLRRIPATKIERGEVLDGSILATLKPPLPVDNMEGVASVPATGGGSRLYLLSDDNFLPFQQTVLLAFRLPVETAARSRR